MKKLFKILFVFAALAAVAAAVFVATFSFDRYREQIEAFASEALGEKVKVAGAARLSFAGWQPSVAFHDVTIGEKGTGSVVHAKKIEGTLPLKKPEGGAPWALFAAAEGLSLGGRLVGDYEGPVFFGADGFDAPEIEGEFGDAKVKGKAAYLRGRLHAEMKAAGVDYKEIFGSVEGGNVTAEFSVDSRGEGADQLVANLNGHFLLVGGPGTMSGRDVDFWASDLLGFVLTAQEKETKVNCIVADYAIANGVMTARRVMIDTARVAIFGEGTIDLKAGRVDMRLTPKPKEKALVNLATPVIARGEFGQVKVTPDPAGLARTVGGLVLSAVNPAMAVVPYVLQDTASKNACEKYLRDKQ